MKELFFYALCMFGLFVFYCVLPCLAVACEYSCYEFSLNWIIKDAERTRERARLTSPEPSATKSPAEED